MSFFSYFFFVVKCFKNLETTIEVKNQIFYDDEEQITVKLIVKNSTLRGSK